MRKEIGIILPKENWLENNIKSYRVTTDGKIDEIKPKNGKFYTLEEMYKHCNARVVEFIYLPQNRIMICDEEGALKSNKRQNWIATKIVADAAEACYRCLEYFIYGDVMIVNESEVE